jgi:hypothetical protein
MNVKRSLAGVVVVTAAAAVVATVVVTQPTPSDMHLDMVKHSSQTTSQVSRKA